MTRSFGGWLRRFKQSDKPKYERGQIAGLSPFGYICVI